MTKQSSGHEVLGAYSALANDVWRLAPDLVPHFARAYNRLEQLVKTRGLRVVLLDLPEFGKLFDKSLSSGSLNVSRLPPALGSWEKGTYLLQDALTLSIYDVDQGELRSEVDPSAVFLLRTFMYMGKTCVKDCPDDAISKAVSEFFSLDRSLRAPSCDWSGDWLDLPTVGMSYQYSHSRHGILSSGEQLSLPLRVETDRCHVPEGLLALLDNVCRSAVSLFPELDTRALVGRHGPGAVADVKTGEDKYTFPFWPKKLDQLFEYGLHAYTREDYVLEADDQPVPHEPAAKLLAVPKSFKGPRLITSEPTAHQFLQQALMRWIRENLPGPLRACLNFQSQEPSRLAALEASRYGDMMTVDLSSASDRLTCWTVERCFKSKLSLLRALHATRTRWVRDATVRGGAGEFAILRKYAGQGNATTFPVQSIVYALLCITAVVFEEDGPNPPDLSERRLTRAARKVRVYGDDIILPSSCGLYLGVLLEFLQLKVNRDKTHYSGSFRESCGMDAFAGYDVTPLYLQATGLPDDVLSAEELLSWVDVSNNALAKGLWSIAAWMDEQIPDKVRKMLIISRTPTVRQHEGAPKRRKADPRVEAAGGIRLYTHVNAVRSKRKRHCLHLQRAEYYTLVARAATVRERRDTHRSLLQYFVEAPEPDTKYESGWTVRNRTQLKARWVPA